MVKQITAVDLHVGQRVRLQRKCRGLTQTQLGEAVGVSFQQIAVYERGINRIGASRLEQIAKTLGVAASFFYQTDVGDPEQSEHAAETMRATEEGYDLIIAFLRIRHPRLRRIVIGFVEELADAETR
ncbi:hypothetical protein ARD30_16345 [Bosea thiooxidans]|uniref:HTH cro/C1-type domain-containing protein n=1 Tax=Bosea thiooxidans TaxID=53254 RepID=A0A0Q3I567_9HYPH|nr:helix-turn-helix transcriptional regulator [Bosea thiooxidans]KQK30016.1 hypothetical protein ARD30_16345 [Bosea thiooxidans]